MVAGDVAQVQLRQVTVDLHQREAVEHQPQHLLVIGGEIAGEEQNAFEAFLRDAEVFRLALLVAIGQEDDVMQMTPGQLL